MINTPRRSAIHEIEIHLLKLGGGNHEDNMKAIREFPRHYLMSLAEQDFMDLIFLETPKLSKLVPAGSDRRLKAVARRATQLLPVETNLGSNWNIAKIRAQFRDFRIEQPNEQMPAFVLRDTRSSERQQAPYGWHLQDGCHRALGLCMAILNGEAQYYPQVAYCATNKILE
jgi:hypothetical protein